MPQGGLRKDDEHMTVWISVSKQGKQDPFSKEYNQLLNHHGPNWLKDNIFSI
jgi:hypothetical protein